MIQPTNTYTHRPSHFLDTTEGKELLDKAENYLDRETSSENEDCDIDTRSLIQKLRVYQIELEMQNEELQTAQHLMTESRARYLQLFQHCPVGLAIINQNGVLQKVNKTLASLMAQDCDALMNRPMHELLTKSSGDLFLGRFRAFFNNPEQKAIECVCQPQHEKQRVLQMRGSRISAPLVIKKHETDEEVLLVSFQDVTIEQILQNEIIRSRNELNQVFNSAIPLQVIDLNFRITKVNQAFCQLLNQNDNELAGRFCYDVWPNPACKTDQCSLLRLRNNEDCCEGEKDLPLPDGETLRCLIKTTAARDQNGNLQGIVKAVLDITERTKAKQALAASEERFRSIIENTSDLILTFSRDGALIYTNRALQKALGYSAEQIAGRHFQDICHQEDISHCWHTFQEMMRGGIRQHEVETVFRTVHGHKIQVEGTVSIHVNKRKKIQTIRGIFRDITLRKTLEGQLRVISITDELTGLLNRRGFMELAAKALIGAEKDNNKLTLLFVDLDGMKQINDSLGHKTGDTALMDIAEILRTVFRDEDIIGRLGGDEFVILFTLCQELPETAELARRLDEYASQICRGKKRPYKLSLSIGSDTYIPGSGISLEHLLSKADAAMYAIKKQRREWRRKHEQEPIFHPPSHVADSMKIEQHSK